MSDKPEKSGGHGGGDGHAEKGHHKKGHGHGGGHGGGHGEHEEGVPEWVVSFADNALLQMGFFVILLALNMGPKAHNEVPGEGEEPTTQSDVVDFAIAVRAGFNNPVDMTSTRPEDQPLIKRLRERSGGKSSEPGPAGDKQNVQSIRPGDYYHLGGVVHFDDGTAEVKPMARVDAEKIAEKMLGRNTIIEVRGYSSAPESFPEFHRGMDLSFQRALAVADILIERGVRKEQLRIIACGDNDRVKPMASDRTQYRVNQRVEVITTEELVPKDPYSTEPTAAAADEGGE